MPTANAAASSYSPPHPLVRADKSALRQRARLVRREAHGAAGPVAAAAVCAALLGSGVLPGAPGVVAGYWPVGSELDCRPTLHALAGLGWQPALPVVTGTLEPLLFRHWQPHQALVPGCFGIPEPSTSAPVAQPALVLVPLLAFDRTGHRLGQGAGYYDRTLEALRAAGAVLAVGLGFAAQEVPALIVDAHDQPLDFIVTENGVFTPQAP